MTEERKKYMKKVSVLLKKGKSRKEIGDILKRDKSWMSKIIKEMRKESPELLEGTAEALTEEQEKAPEQPIEPSSKPIEAPEEHKHSELQMTSFRADIEDLKRWKVYAKVKRMTTTKLYSLAVNEFLENHPLNEKEKNAFDVLVELEK